MIFASDRDDPSRLEQQAALKGTSEEQIERAVVTLEVLGDEVLADPPPGRGTTAASLRRHFEVDDGAFAVILVGKDGRAKLRSSRPVTAERLFERIDAMPMRRAETGHERAR